MMVDWTPPLTLSLGHCYLMMEDLQQAYASYQQALYHLPNPQVSRARCVLTAPG